MRCYLSYNIPILHNYGNLVIDTIIVQVLTQLSWNDLFVHFQMGKGTNVDNILNIMRLKLIYCLIKIMSGLRYLCMQVIYGLSDCPYQKIDWSLECHWKYVTWILFVYTRSRIVIERFLTWGHWNNALDLTFYCWLTCAGPTSKIKHLRDSQLPNALWFCNTLIY